MVIWFVNLTQRLLVARRLSSNQSKRGVVLGRGAFLYYSYFHTSNPPNERAHFRASERTLGGSVLRLHSVSVPRCDL